MEKATACTFSLEYNVGDPCGQTDLIASLYINRKENRTHTRQSEQQPSMSVVEVRRCVFESVGGIHQLVANLFVWPSRHVVFTNNGYSKSKRTLFIESKTTYYLTISFSVQSTCLTRAIYCEVFRKFCLSRGRPCVSPWHTL